MTTDHIFITTRQGEKRIISQEELIQLKKDILWVYDEHAGDLRNPYIPDNSFTLKYWEYLRLDGDKWFYEEERKFYRQGVLIIILCMTIDYIDTISGNPKIFGTTNISEIQDHIETLELKDSDEIKLKDILLLALGIANSMTKENLQNTFGFDHPELEKLLNQLDWVDATFIIGYFKNFNE